MTDPVHSHDCCSNGCWPLHLSLNILKAPEGKCLWESPATSTHEHMSNCHFRGDLETSFWSLLHSSDFLCSVIWTGVLAHSLGELWFWRIWRWWNEGDACLHVWMHCLLWNTYRLLGFSFFWKYFLNIDTNLELRSKCILLWVDNHDENGVTVG